MVHYSHLTTAGQIITSYQGAQPFSLFIREFFRADKKYGSRDRRQISHLCYCYFRLGKTAITLPLEERLLLALFLCSTEPNGLLEKSKPGWNAVIQDSIDEKLAVAGIPEDLAEQFPALASVSPTISIRQFQLSHFRQPDLFLRIRPGRASSVKAKLEAAGVEFNLPSAETVALHNSTKVDQIITLDQDAVVQDLSSQQVASLFPKRQRDLFRVWDCCAASGGKSIMAIDHYGNTDLTVTDIRQNILFNLEQRFARAGIKTYKSFVADLGSAAFTRNRELAAKKFDLVIADVPCSGSGTWGRTPEHLLYFQAERITHYATLQRQIVDNSIGLLADDGYYLYITCSVYKEENEEAVAHIRSKGLKVLSSQYFEGYNQKADTMFAALFSK